MGWYFVEAGASVGPLEEADFVAAVRAGRLAEKTLVWKQGMENWLPLASVRPDLVLPAPITPSSSTPAPAAAPLGVLTAACSECGRSFPTTDMIQHQGLWVCATCKPVFLQKLQQGLPLKRQFVYAGFWTRFGARFVDGLLLWVVSTILQFPLIGFPLFGSPRRAEGLFLGRTLLAFAIAIAIPIAYFIYFHGKDGATLGKKLFKIRVVRSDGSPIGYARATGRYFADILSSLTCLIGYIMAAFDEEKRALHDRICDTRVIQLA